MSADLHETLRFLQQENARLREENRELREELDLVREVVDALRLLQSLSTQITPGADILALLDKILYAALTVIDAADGSLLLRDEDTGDLVFTVTHGARKNALSGYRVAPGRGIAQWVAEHRLPAMLSDVRQDPRFWPGVDEALEFVTHSMLCVPIATASKVFGVITALNKFSGREFVDADLSLLAIVAQLAASALERAEQSIEAPAPAPA